jgi:protein phosphatase
MLDRLLGDENTPSVEVDIFTVQLQSGDTVLLCSDGLWRRVRDPRIEEIIAQAPSDLSVAADTLIQAALDGGGGKDDASVIVVSMVEGDEQRLVAGGQVFIKTDGIEMPQFYEN